jgi:hypothetical protein
VFTLSENTPAFEKALQEAEPLALLMRLERAVSSFLKSDGSLTNQASSSLEL